MLRWSHGLMGWVVLVAGWVLLAAAPAMATAFTYAPGSIFWTIDANLADGGTVTGFLVTDITDSSKSITDWDVIVSGGNLPPFTFTPGDSTATLTGDPLFDMLQTDPFELQWTTIYWPPGGGEVPITGGFFSAGSEQTRIVNGDLDGTPVPEPPSGALLLTGALALLACAALRRRSTAQIRL